MDDLGPHPSPILSASRLFLFLQERPLGPRAAVCCFYFFLLCLTSHALSSLKINIVVATVIWRRIGLGFLSVLGCEVPIWIISQNKGGRRARKAELPDQFLSSIIQWSISAIPVQTNTNMNESGTPPSPQNNLHFLVFPVNWMFSWITIEFCPSPDVCAVP